MKIARVGNARVRHLLSESPSHLIRHGLHLRRAISRPGSRADYQDHNPGYEDKRNRYDDKNKNDEIKTSRRFLTSR
jgi:hypothetical protein